MNQLSVAVILLIGAAILAFWALGAYNRLMRLRSNLLNNLHALVTQWDGTARILRTTLLDFAAEPASESQWGSLGNEDAPWRSLSLAAKQLQACMVGMLSKPNVLPSADDLTSLRAARELIDSAWERLESTNEDLAGASVPLKLTALWRQHDAYSDEKRKNYNIQAVAYNAAVKQFPALLVAWIFSFNSTVYL